MTEEQKLTFEELRLRAKEYAWNVLFADKGPFTPEAYEKELAKAQLDREALYTDFSDDIFKINMEHLIQGYSSFGRDFLVGVISQDLDSAVAMFETATQHILDLTAQVNAFEASLQKRITELKEKNSKIKTEETTPVETESE